MCGDCDNLGDDWVCARCVHGSLFNTGIEQLPHEDDEVTQLQRAGMHECTEVDTVLNANGNYIFVTGV